jgi:hypothetical protein
MEFKVREVGEGVEKSKAEIEEKLLQEHSATVEGQPELFDNTVEKVEMSTETQEVETPEVEVDVEKETPSLEINDENVLSYIKERYNKDIQSVDQLFEEREANEDLPEDVKKYFEYKKATGRGIEDFYKLQRDYGAMDDDTVLADYLSIQEEGLDEIDIQDLMEDKYGYDEDLDDERDIKKKKLAKKRELAKARKFFSEQRDQYQIPLESSGGQLSEEQQQNLSAYQKYIEDSKTIEEQNRKRYSYFLDRTKEVFNSEFKGFEFGIGDQTFNYKPGTSEELLNKQSDVNNFVGKYLDSDGLIADPKGYHKALSVAMNPDKFAQYFFDQGMAAAVDNVTRKSKNINMDVRSTPQKNTNKDGLKIRAVGNQSSGRGLKIKSIKNV